jgi:hypothetical protein
MRILLRRFIGRWDRTNCHRPAATEYSEDDVEQMRIANQTFVKAVPVGVVQRSNKTKGPSMLMLQFLDVPPRPPHRKIDPAPAFVEAHPVMQVHLIPSQIQVKTTPDVVTRHPPRQTLGYADALNGKKTVLADNEDVQQTKEDICSNPNGGIPKVLLSRRHRRTIDFSVASNESELSKFSELFLTGQLGIGYPVEDKPVASAMPPIQLLVCTQPGLHKKLSDISLLAVFPDDASCNNLVNADFLNDQETESSAKLVDIKCHEKDNRREFKAPKLSQYGGDDHFAKQSFCTGNIQLR